MAHLCLSTASTRVLETFEFLTHRRVDHRREVMSRHEPLEAFELATKLTARGELHDLACRSERLELLAMVPRFGGGFARRFRITTSGRSWHKRELNVVLDWTEELTRP